MICSLLVMVSDLVKAWFLLIGMGAVVYGCAAFTRPHEPAGRLLHEVLNSLPPTCH